MTDESTAPAGETNEQPATFEPITSQEDFDKAIQARIARERSKFADYDEVKARADKLAEIEEANKTEAERTAERLAAAEKRNAELVTKATRAEVAAAKGVPIDLLSGSTKEELEAAADALIAFRGEQKQTPTSTAISRANTANTAAGPADAFADHLASQLGR